MKKQNQKLGKPRKKDIVRDTVLALVLCPTNKTAAEFLHLSEKAIEWRLSKYPEIKEKLSKIPERALLTLQAGSLKAAEVFVKNLNSKIKDMDAAREVLNRVGIVSKTPTIAQQFNVEGQGVKVEIINYGDNSSNTPQIPTEELPTATSESG